MDNNKISQLLAFTKEKIIHEFGDKVHSIFLFGSRARGDFRADSDIDLLILFQSCEKIGEKERQILRGLTEKIYLEHQVIVQIFPFLKSDFKPEENLFFRTIQREGQLL